MTARAVAIVGLALLLAGAGAGAGLQQPGDPAGITIREAAYRANNLGITRLEQFEFPAAAAAFRQALEIAPDLAIARLNLGIALFYAGQTDEARREIEAARPLLPDRPHPDYLLGLIERLAGNTAEARAAFTRALALDASDVGIAVNLGQLYAEERRFDEALGLLRRAVEAEPYNATAAYALAMALLRSGSTEEGTAAMTRFERLRESVYAVTYAQTYLEQGRYAEAIASTGAEEELVDPATPEVGFSSASGLLPQAGAAAGAPSATAASGPMPTSPAQSAAVGVTLADLDADGDLDLVESGPDGLRVLVNQDGRFIDGSAVLPATVAGSASIAAVAGDYDNDGDADLALLQPGGLRLLRRESPAAFADVTDSTALAGIAGSWRSAAWLDADHDGDLDLVVAAGSADPGAAATRLYRNNGNGQFTDITADSGLVVNAAIAATVPTDFDNRRDIDLLVVAAANAPRLFRNMRDGTFRDVAGEVGLVAPGGAAMAAIADVNKDGFPDLFLPQPAGPGVLAMSDGRGRFTAPAPPATVANARAALWLDYDSDGLLDLVALTAAGPLVLRNVGRAWTDVTARAVPAPMAEALSTATALAAGDLDGDGHTDLVARGASGTSVWRNDAGTQARALRVRLTPRVSNRTAAGAKVEMRAGSLRQRHEVYAATPPPAPAGVTFGLGERAGADVVRVLWPSGILQAETGPDPAAPLAGALSIEELDRKPSSCPYLFTWNGERFEFLTDFLGGGEMGYWVAPGVRNTPDPDEYVRIPGDKLRALDGRYELRVTNELEETLFLDRAELVVVAHPDGTDVYPNEGLVASPEPFRLYTVERPRPPLAAEDASGSDVLDRISSVDRQYSEPHPLESIRGYAAPHTLTLTLPPPGPAGRRVLLLTGWTDYAFSGDNVAAHQAGLSLVPPSLEVKDADGRWRTAIDGIGTPVGRPQTVVVDLSRAVPATARDVRIRTSMRIYWDQVLVDTSDGAAPFQIARLPAASAHLTWRGYSAELTPDGREPYGYDFARVSLRSPWKLMPGRYTREGDVRPLIERTDDMFVVSRTGDALALSFDASALPPLPPGWTRTFLFHADGFSKEMNLHSASPDALLPLPFHGMTQYPYAPPEAYPSTPAHREYLERYNTRVVPRAIPPL
jgi:Flp pilus assembly protein TadD